MKKAGLILIGAVIASTLTACVDYEASDRSAANDPGFSEPTFVSVQPVAYPHPTGCEACGFPSRLGSAQQ
jgi:hypothetical protein